MSPKRAKLVLIISFILFLALICRIFILSTLNFNETRKIVKGQQAKETAAKNVRGQICDRNSIPFTDRSLKMMYLKENGKIGYEDKNSKYSFSLPARSPSIAAHVTGYTAKDGTGLSGIEKEYNDVLKDKGKTYISYLADAGGNPLDSFSVKETPLKSYTEVRLTLDYHIQKIAEEVMDKYIKKGAAVIIDTQSFEILAMVSRPGFDGNNILKYKDSKNSELLNRAISPYNAGSVFKIVTAASVLEKNPVCTQGYFDCRGSFYLDENTIFNCNKADGHGMISFKDAFAKSCNCAYYVLGTEAGGLDLINTAKGFGMGESLLGGILEESAGNMPQKEEYSPGDNLNLAIGQGEILITPLQCAAMTATVANGGIRKDVSLVKENDIELNEKQVIKKETADILKTLMRECVLSGTGSKAASSPAMIGGKTGSAQSGWVENGKALVHGWFCGFFPFDAPRYAMAVLSEGGLSGADSCVMPFMEIAEKINEIYPYKQ